MTEIQEPTDVVHVGETTNGQLTQRPQEATAITATAYFRPQLALALAKAQAACIEVPKNGYNRHFGYSYATAEDIIAAGKAALSSCSLSLVPLEQSLNRIQEGNESRYELERKFILLHSSGEWMPQTLHWPVSPEKGRPLDKATAVAATLSLSYLLRDLLLMPRVSPADEADSDVQNSERPGAAQPSTQPAESPRQQQQPSGQKPPVISDGQHEEIGRLLDASGADVQKFCNFFGIADTDVLLARDYDRAVSLLNQKIAEKTSA